MSTNPQAAPFGNAANPFGALFAHLDNIGRTPQLIQAMQNHYASNLVPAFDSNLQAYHAQAAAMGWSSVLGSDYFRLENLTQPTLTQVRALSSRTQWDGIGATYQNALNWFTWYVDTYGRRRSPNEVRFELARYSSSKTQQNAEVGAAVGGTLAGGHRNDARIGDHRSGRFGWRDPAPWRSVCSPEVWV